MSVQQGHKKLLPTKVCNRIHLYKGGWIIGFDHCVLKCKSGFLLIQEQKNPGYQGRQGCWLSLREVRSFTALQRWNFRAFKRFDRAPNLTIQSRVQSAMLTWKYGTVNCYTFLPGYLRRTVKKNIIPVETWPLWSSTL